MPRSFGDSLRAAVRLASAASVAVALCGTATAALVGHWSFDVDYSDSSGNGNNFLPVNGEPPLIGAGRLGNAASFNNASASLENAASGLVGAYRSFTLGAWVKLAQPPDGVSGAAVLADPALGAGLTIHSDGRAYAHAGGESFSISTPGSLPANVWRHVVQTYDGVAQTTRLFIDGSPVATGSPVPNSVSINALTIGRLSTEAPGLDALVDEAFLFDEVLSDAQIRSLANPTTAGTSPARFWITQYATEPLPQSVGPSGSLEVDLLRPADVAHGEYATFYVWAQPGLNAAGFYKQLQNISLNIVADQTSIDILDTIRIVNPRIDLDGDRRTDVARFTTAFDSGFADSLNPALRLQTFTPDQIRGDDALGLPPTPDQALGLTAANEALFQVAAGVGLGPWPISGDSTAKMTPFGPAWQVASFTIRSLPLQGAQDAPALIRLQIGARGLNHAGEHTADSLVMFAPPGHSGPVYRAGPSGDREITLPGDAPDVLIRISDELAGDFTDDRRVDGGDFLAWQSGMAPGGMTPGNLALWQTNLGRPLLTPPSLTPPTIDKSHGDYTGDGLVDGADFLAWQLSLGSTTNLAADGDRNGIVDAADVFVWNANFGQINASGPAGPVGAAAPEPGTVLLGITATLLALSLLRRSAMSARAMGLVLVSVSAMGAGHLSAAEINASWRTPASANWTTAARWNPTGVPNNGANSYNATIAVVFGSDDVPTPYTVTLNSDVTVSGFVLSASNATVNHSAGTFAVSGDAMLLAGTFRQSGGTLLGGTWHQSGGTIDFSGTSILSGAAIIGNLTLGTDVVRLQNGATFTGSASLTGGGSFSLSSVLSVEQAMLLDNRTITLGNLGLFGVGGTNQLTLGANALVRLTGGNARITSDLAGQMGTGTITNQGTIIASSGFLSASTIDPDEFHNQGTVLVSSGVLNLSPRRQWTNTGAGVYQVASGATLSVSGEYTTSALGKIDNTAGGIVTLNGTLEITDGVLDVNAATGSLTLGGGGTIIGGEIRQNDGLELLFGGGAPHILDGTTLVGDLNLTPSAFNSVAVRLQHGATFTGDAHLSAASTHQAILSVEHSLTLDNRTIDLGNRGVLGVSGGNTLTLGPNTIVNLSGTRARLGVDLLTDGDAGTIVNQGTIKVNGAGNNRTIDPLIFRNQGTVLISGASVSLGEKGQFHNEGVLDIRGGASVVAEGEFTHHDRAELKGAGTFKGAFTNEAAVRPGNSPGVLTIDGDYTQTADGQLEIEIARGAPPTTPGVDHDQLVVTGTATLGGLMEVPFIDGYVPAIGDGGATGFRILAASTRIGVFDNTRFPTRLPEGVAQQVVYNGPDVFLQFVDPKFMDLASTAPSPTWSTPADWNEEGVQDAPTSENIVTVSNQRIGGGPQRVDVNDPTATDAVNAAHRLVIGDDSDLVTLSLNDAALSVTTDAVIEANGALEQSAGSALSSLVLDVRGGGRFEGGGRVIADVTVGMTGAGAATFAPGLDGADRLAIDGNYAQGADGVLEVQLMSSPAAGDFDRMDVEGAVAIDGTLRVDVTDLPALAANESFTLISADAGGGEFDRIELVDPTGVADGYYFSPFYGTAAALPGGAQALVASDEWESGINVFLKGDADGRDGINENDARVFAAVLVKSDLSFYKLGEGHFAAANFACAFDFYKIGAPAGETIIDFDDIPGFLAALSASTGSTLTAASSVFRAAYQQALSAKVPEPSPRTTALSIFALGLAWRRRSPSSRSHGDPRRVDYFLLS